MYTQINCLDSAAICIQRLINTTPKYQVYGSNDTSCKLYFHKLHKSWKRGEVPPTVRYQAYTQDPKLCVVKTLDGCKSGTEGWRSGEECSQLLLSLVNPHKPAVYFTISSWLKNVLRKAGIDIGTLKAHSIRFASTSKADLSGAPTEEILKQWCWSNKSTWKKFYNKSIIQEGQLFQAMVFK